MFQLAKYIKESFFASSSTKTDKTLRLATFLKNKEPNQTMPEEVFDVDKFVEAADRAEYCSIKRLRKTVKLKLRTPKKLYTMQVEPTKAEEIIKKLRCEIREI